MVSTQDNDKLFYLFFLAHLQVKVYLIINVTDIKSWGMVKTLPTVVFPLYLFVLSPSSSLCQSVSNFTQDR